MYLFSMYVLFIKHNSPSTCQQWWTKILPTGYLWVPQQNRTNKETLQTGYSCCLLSQGWGGGLCQPCPHTCRQCSTDTAPRAAQSSPASLCKECFKHPDSWKPGKATVCNVLSMAAHIHVLLQAGATASLQSLDPCMAQHQPPAAVAGEMPAVPAPWEALGSRRGRGPGHACPTLAHTARAGIPSLTPHDCHLCSSCTPQSTPSIQCITVLSTDIGFTALRTLSPQNLMGRLSGLKQTLDGQVLLGQDICLSCESSDFTEQHWIPSWKERAKKGVRTNEGRDMLSEDKIILNNLYFC